ncbi:glycine--tRNA ligase subunit beta [Slackia equolifaciens]|uniref:Glycine--tRNA ligase beta subunit n=1 Tax=Slackia equolifaciens TaxID=498718 RepID=A0A3N0B1M5_9ACTN|nr:glycine--tRNA ligase subunit beta [Slackia equolifaciens]RNL41005.1 glycine--tRNA ligase subunit beta [Slackia equolifaciens]
MAETRSFLFEIGTEEMPSAPLMNAVKQLPKLMCAGLDAAGLAHGEVRVVSSPRRLAVLSAVAIQTEAVHDVKRGPAANIAFDGDGNPTKAAEGFARKCGMTAAELVRREDTDGREYVFAEKDIPAAPALPLLSSICHDVIAKLEWPNYRSQRWGSTHDGFVRPIRWICALLGEEVIPVQYADVTSGNTTRGHRILGAGDHVVANPDVYEQVLESAGVLTEERRREVIAEGIKAIEDQRGGAHVDTPAKVLNEVVNLCEWPSVLVGTFDEVFLNVPHEIICESMLSNQRYFPIYDSEGNLTREFVVVGNGRPECADAIIDGNERVVRARLYDAKFFYDEDLKIPLEEFRGRLANVAFQEKLGSVLQKSERIEKLAAAIAEEAALDAQTAEDACRAAHLAKADLVSSAVIEFTSQQGVMGGYYAKAAGENDQVAAAIRDHYRPRFAGDELPQGDAGCVVAVADKLDTIVGMFAIDEPPTGSKDPFALRRSAIGVLNILRERLGCGYEALVRAALKLYAEQGLSFDEDAVACAVCSFIHGRMEQMARDEGLSADTVASVSAGSITVPTDFFCLAHALEDARANDAETFDNLATAYARANNLRNAELGSHVDESLINEVEHSLFCAVVQAEGRVERALFEGDFGGVIAELASLRKPIDLFFDRVKVMDDDAALRDNRLRLLNRFVGVFANIADFAVLGK